MNKRFVLLLFFLVFMVLCLFVPGNNSIPSEVQDIDPADTAWMLASTALVLIMTPGLAFFYGGMVSKKNVISTMLQSFVSMVVITILWVLFGFSLCFGKSIGGIIGNPLTFFMMKDVMNGTPWITAPTIPLVLYAIFQLKFAIITPALITGAFAERIRFSAYLLFISLFSVFIYSPLAHATWHPEGILFKLGVLDFAGGTVIHMSAGWAALAGAVYLKRRHDVSHSPARITYVMIGTGLLWFGWFGFNAGSAYAANSTAANALATTSIASAAAAFAWICFDVFRKRKPTAMGTCIGIVVGLVAITPATGYVSISHAVLIGCVSSIVSNLVIEFRSRTSIDDTLDVFPSHGVGGIVGMLLTGVFASSAVNSAVVYNGIFFGESRLFLVQLLAMVCVSGFIFVGTWILLKITDMLIPLRVDAGSELMGLDLSQHGEKL